MKITPIEVREAMKRYKAEGHTNQEVAEKFNINYETTKAICKRSYTKEITEYVGYVDWFVIGMIAHTMVTHS